MPQPYLGEIKIWPCSFPPKNWAFCDGALLPVKDNDALFNLLGNTYGGDGKTNFALPDLRSRVPVHQNTVYRRGTKGGAETVVLKTAELPPHHHAVQTTAAPGKFVTPASNTILADEATNTKASAFTYLPYASGSQTALAPVSVTTTGAGKAHDNVQPFLALMFIISLEGIYPQVG